MANEKKRLVVIGNGMAGVAAVEEILRLDADRYEITVFGKEKYPNYNRVLLTDLLTEEKTLPDITLNDFDWYKENNIRLITNCPVTEINRGKKTVTGEDGTTADYDFLVIATGSLPFIPPIDGVDKEGVVGLRDIDDCEKIRKFMTEGGKAVVIGGGLLGLEAARGLKKLDLDVTVVHLMDRLMERQLDEKSAAYLKEDLERMDIKIMLEAESKAITGNGRVTGIEFASGEALGADLIVMAAGIKPNKALAEASGLYSERGIVVSDTMQTFDPAVFAVGECVQLRGETFGLVAHVFDQARVLANHLAGDSRLAFVSRPISTRLKIPGIDLYSAGIVEERLDTELIEYHDRGARAYKRILLHEGRIVGIVMYGDTLDGATLFTHLIGGDDVTQRRRELLLGSADGGGKSSASIAALPDETIICGCKGVTKGMIVDSVKTKGLFTLEDVKKETDASTSCGGCSQMIEQILESVLGSSFDSTGLDKGICDCTKYTREDVIKNIKEQELKSVAEVMEALGWETVGCEECRPALNYYVGVVHKEATDDPTSRLVNERVHANIQTDGTFSVVPRIYGGVTTAKELKRIADVAERYDVPLIKITGGQRIDLVGIAREELPKVWKDLDMPSGYAYGKALRTVKSCVGKSYCRYGTQDSLSLAIALEKRFEKLWMPAKVKLSVSGCPRNCSESAIKDVGIVGVSGVVTRSMSVDARA